MEWMARGLRGGGDLVYWLRERGEICRVGEIDGAVGFNCVSGGWKKTVIAVGIRWRCQVDEWNELCIGKLGLQQHAH